jgi:hypothetical protein
VRRFGFADAVIVVTGSKLGATHVINSRQADCAAEGERYDVIVAPASERLDDLHTLVRMATDRHPLWAPPAGSR